MEDPDAVLPIAGTVAPSLAEFEVLAEAARARLPDPWAEAARAVVIRVEDLARADMVQALGVDDPYELTGLYDGVPLPQKSVMDQPHGADVIWLFRRAILEEWIDRGNVTLGDLVAHVLIHELAHHFGWSDDDIARVDRWWE